MQTPRVLGDRHTIFTHVQVAPKHKTHPNLCLDFLVSSHIRNIVISNPGLSMRHTPSFGAQFWDKRCVLYIGWMRYTPELCEFPLRQNIPPNHSGSAPYNAGPLQVPPAHLLREPRWTQQIKDFVCPSPQWTCRRRLHLPCPSPIQFH